MPRQDIFTANTEFIGQAARRIDEIKGQVQRLLGEIAAAGTAVTSGPWRGAASRAAAEVIGLQEQEARRLLDILTRHTDATARTVVEVAAQEGDSAGAVRAAGAVNGTQLNLDVTAGPISL